MIGIDNTREKFEAAHQHLALNRDTRSGKYCAFVEDRWQGWLACTIDANTHKNEAITMMHITHHLERIEYHRAQYRTLIAK